MAKMLAETAAMADENGRLPKLDSEFFDDGWSEKQDLIQPPARHHAHRTRIDPRIISDATIGLSDGLTVPFALTAGLSALGDNSLVIYAGLAELIAGGISMGLGGFLGAKSEAEAYQSTLQETRALVCSHREIAARQVRATFAYTAISGQTLDRLVDELVAEPAELVAFLMQFHHQLAETKFTPRKAYISGLTIALGYFFGGLVPLLPYTLFGEMDDAFQASVVVMVIALFAFGWLKTACLGSEGNGARFKSGCQMVMLGGAAAGAAMGCVKAIG